MKKVISICLFLFLGITKYAAAQVESPPVPDANTHGREIMTFVEQMPQFEGDLNEYLRKEIVYPTKAREKGIQGKVILQFVITDKGKVTDITLLRSPDELLSKEAIRVVESMPDWKPGKQNGKPVNVRYTLPISFNLK